MRKPIVAAALASLAILTSCSASHSPHAQTSKPKAAVDSFGPVPSTAAFDKSRVSGTVPVAGSCHYRDTAAGILPDRHCSPGAIGAAINAVNIQRTTCNAKFLQTLTLDPAAMQAASPAVLRAYGVPADAASGYVVDYVVPPALGGLADYRNLWPVPAAHQTSAKFAQLQSTLISDVCAGKVGVQAAGYMLGYDWTAAKTRLRLK